VGAKPKNPKIHLMLPQLKIPKRVRTFYLNDSASVGDAEQAFEQTSHFAKGSSLELDTSGGGDSFKSVYDDLVLISAIDDFIVIFKALGRGEVEPNGHLINDDTL